MFVAGLLSMLILLLSEMFDSFAAGAYVNENAVVAIELVTPFEYIEFAIVMLYTYGTGTLYNRAKGSHDNEKCQKIAGMGLLTATVGGVLMYALINIFAQQIIDIYSCTVEVFTYAVSYLKKSSLYLLPYSLYYHFSFMAITDGDETIALISNIVSSILAICLPSFLAANFGFLGIAMTMTITSSISLLIALCHFLSKRNSISYRLYFSFKDFVEQLKISSSYSLTNIHLALTDIIFNSVIISQYSDSHLLAYAVINITLNLAEVQSAAITMARPFISVYYGENRPDGIKAIIALTMKLGIILSVILSAIMIIVAPYWASLFSIENNVIIDLATFAGMVIPSTYLFSFLVFTLIDYYPAVNHSLLANIVGALYMMIGPLAICLPLAYFASFKAMTIGFAITPVFAIASLAAYFVITKKKDAPWFLPPSIGQELVYNIYINEENIIFLRDKLMDDLIANNIDSTLTKEIGIVIEDGLRLIQKQNKKKIISEISVLLNAETICLTIKDDGKIFDLIKAANDSETLAAYTVDRMLTNTYQKDNDLVLSFNRNVFSWNLK